MGQATVVVQSYEVFEKQTDSRRCAVDEAKSGLFHFALSIQHISVV